MYEAEKKYVSTAVGWNLLFPGVGNFYARQYLPGGLYMGLGVFGYVFIVYGAYTEQPDLIGLGLIGIGGAYGMSIAHSIKGVHEYNHDLEYRLGLNHPNFAHLRQKQLRIVRMRW